MSTNRQNFDTSKQAPTWTPDRPYDQLPGLPPDIDLETRAALKACIGARAALAELKQATALIPNPAMLINTLPMLEAQASSAIENIVTTADELFRQLPAERVDDPAAREALRYREALLEGARALRDRPLGTGAAERICSRIKDVDVSVRRVPGTALKSSTSGRVVYTPPEGEARIRDLLADWERFLHAGDDLDPLIRMAVAHYQFEAIHPFTDGNGRTGRILNSLFLVDRGLLGLPILYLSRFINTHRAEYHQLLLGVTRDADWDSWVVYLLRGVEETARWTTDKIRAIRDLAEHTREHVRAALPKLYSHELVDVIFEQPYCRIGHLVAAGIAERQTASRYLAALVDLGVLQQQVAGRTKLFLHPKLLRVLTTEGDAFDPYAPP